jgi:dihydrofolate synthase/folylpolyglutamate synthase
MKQAEEILNRLFAKSTDGIKLGLDRMYMASQSIGNPQNCFRSFHIAGTNGKGSVCAYLDSSLRMAGYRTGLFTSPHIRRFEERFIIDGRPVMQKTWLDVYSRIEKTVEEFNLTFFEASALIAFELFKNEKIDVAVIETGMGGRLDATNIINPVVSVITAIGIDHTEYLGPNIVSIAREKLGIVKEGVPLVMSKPDERAVAQLAEQTCLEKNCRLVTADASELSDVKYTDRETGFRYGGVEYKTMMRGNYQPINALCAIKALDISGLCSKENAKKGIAATRVPGRFDCMQIKGKTVIFDVGHNPQAFKGLVSTIDKKFPGSRIVFVTGIMKDKDAALMISEASKCASEIIFTAPATKRACPASVLAGFVPRNYKGNVRIIENVGKAVQTALESGPEIVCIAGSFYTVGEAMESLCIEPYRGDIL